MNMPASSARLTDPDGLLANWGELKARHHHLHNPQAALLLGVPEGALVAARIGQGAVALRPDAAALLAGIADWRRILVATRSDAGVSLAFDAISTMEAAERSITLQGQAFLSAWFDPAAVAHAFWFEERDEMHGRTQSLQFFDAAGRDVLKLLILHKAAAEQARAGFARFELPAQDRAPAWAPQPPSAPRREIGPAGRQLFALLKALDGHAEDLCVTSENGNARSTYRGPIDSTSVDETMAHAAAISLKLHLRPAGVCAAEIDEAGVAFSSDRGPALTIAPARPNEAFSAIARSLREIA